MLPLHIIKPLSYYTAKPLESQREALAAGKPAHIVHTGTSHRTLPRGILRDAMYTVLDTPGLDGTPLPTRTELGLVVSSGLKFQALVGKGPNSPGQTLSPGESPGGSDETEWLGGRDQHKDVNSTSLAHKRQLTIGVQWSIPVSRPPDWSPPPPPKTTVHIASTFTIFKCCLGCKLLLTRSLLCTWHDPQCGQRWHCRDNRSLAYIGIHGPMHA